MHEELSPSRLIGIDEAVPLMQAVRSRAVGEDKSCTSVALSKFLIVNRTYVYVSPDRKSLVQIDSKR